jgi:hypothetical protein
MSDEHRWQDALDMAQRIEHRERERWVLSTLAQLPFLSEGILEQLAGVKRRGLHPTMLRLVKASAVGSIAPPLHAGHSPRLFYLADLGIATLAVLHDVEPGPLAQRLRISRPALLRLIPRLPVLQDTYRLLGAAAVACTAPAALVCVERPWRRRWHSPVAKAPLSVELPALAQFSWAGRDLECLFIPDRGHVSMRTYRSTLNRLVRFRTLQNGTLPLLVVATDGDRRADAWKRANRELAEACGEAPLRICIVIWSNLATCLEGLTVFAGHRDAQPRPIQPPLVQGLPALQMRPNGRRIPKMVGPLPPPEPNVGTAGERLAYAAFQIAPSDRDVLDLIGRHPFLSRSQLAKVVGCGVQQIRQTCKRLEVLELTRVVRPEEVPLPRRILLAMGKTTRAIQEALAPEDIAQLQLAELTGRGAEVLAAGWGLPPQAAQRSTGLVGGGPDEGFGARFELIKHLRHTVESNSVFIDLIISARQQAKVLGSAAVTWRSATSCARGTMRPDGYAMIDYGSHSFGFFLEYDRGTESARDYRKKFSTYYRYAETGRFARDYDGFPTVLIVTTDPGAEDRIAAAIRAVSVGRATSLCFLLTLDGYISRRSESLDASIWRDPWSNGRRAWPTAGSALRQSRTVHSQQS